MKTIPESVKVGPYRYRIEHVSNLRGKKGDKRCGDVHHTKLRIRLEDDMAHDQKFETLIHECLHAMSVTTHLNIQEEVIGRLSMAVAAFLIDNGFVE